MHTILFDIDGTLLASGGAGKAALETSLLAEFGLAALRGQVTYGGRTDRAICRDLFQLHEIVETPDALRRLVGGYLQRLPASLAEHRGRVLPGIAELLDALRGRTDVVVGLLTGNLREGARVKLGHFGLAGHFRFGGYGDEHFDRDEVAHLAMAEARRHLNGAVDPGRTWVIGDTPLDVRCARAVGARAVAVATGWHSRDELAASQPDLLLDDLADPTPFLDCLTA